MVARKIASVLAETSAAVAWPVIGHATAVDFLQRAVSRDEASHAYLIIGPEQLGKATLARHFAWALLCEQSAQGSACGVCLQCQQNQRGIHPDLAIIQPTQNEEKATAGISIEAVRDGIHQLQLRPAVARRRVGLLLDADQLGAEATHALLKTLEEPAGDTVIILTANSRHRLPKTIFSRCQVITLRPVPAPMIADWLVTHGVSRDRAKRLSGLALGRPGAAWDFANTDEREQAVQDVVGEIMSLLRLPGSVDQRWKIVGRWASADQLPDQLRSICEQVIHDLLQLSLGRPDQVIHQSFRAELSRIASQRTPAQICQLITELRRLDRYLRAHVSPKLALEQFALSI